MFNLITKSIISERFPEYTTSIFIGQYGRNISRGFMNSCECVAIGDFKGQIVAYYDFLPEIAVRAWRI